MLSLSPVTLSGAGACAMGNDDKGHPLIFKTPSESGHTIDKRRMVTLLARFAVIEWSVGETLVFWGQLLLYQ